MKPVKWDESSPQNTLRLWICENSWECFLSDRWYVACSIGEELVVSIILNHPRFLQKRPDLQHFLQPRRFPPCWGVPMETHSPRQIDYYPPKEGGLDAVWSSVQGVRSNTVLCREGNSADLETDKNIQNNTTGKDMEMENENWKLRNAFVLKVSCFSCLGSFDWLLMPA